MKGWSGRCVSRVEGVRARACVCACKVDWGSGWLCVCAEGGVRRASCVRGGRVVADVRALHIPFRQACSPPPRSHGNVFIKRRSSPNTLVLLPTCRYLFFASPPHLSLFCLIPLASSVEKQLCALIIGVYNFTDIPRFGVWACTP